MSQEGDGAAAGVPDQRAGGRAARAGLHQLPADHEQRGGGARRRAERHDPGADQPDRRPDRRLVAVGGARRGAAAQPERRPPDRPERLRRAGPRARAPAAVLRRHLVPDGLRAAAGRQDRVRQAEAGPAVRPDVALYRRPEGVAGVPDRRAAVLPRRRAVAVQRHPRRRGQHLPRPAVFIDRVREDRQGQRGGAAARHAWPSSPPDELRRPPPSRRRGRAFFADKEEHLREYARAPAPGDRGGQGVLAPPGGRRARRS